MIQFGFRWLLRLDPKLETFDAQVTILLDIIARLIVSLYCGPDGSFSGFVGSQNVTMPTDALPLGLQQLHPFHCPTLRSASGVDLEIPLKVLSLLCIQASMARS